MFEFVFRILVKLSDSVRKLPQIAGVVAVVIVIIPCYPIVFILDTVAIFWLRLLKRDSLENWSDML